jgi:hypothetical protein
MANGRDCENRGEHQEYTQSHARTIFSHIGKRDVLDVLLKQIDISLGGGGAIAYRIEGVSGQTPGR